MNMRGQEYVDVAQKYLHLARIEASSGFTLIELLVVIAIIGVLAAVIIVSASSARSKGLDAARMSDIHEMKTAMEIYYTDHHTYPQDSTANAGHPIATLSTFLSPTYVGRIASLLISDTDQYAWGSSGQSYAFRVYLSNGTSCKTGMNINTGWWGATVPICNF